MGWAFVVARSSKNIPSTKYDAELEEDPLVFCKYNFARSKCMLSNPGSDTQDLQNALGIVADTKTSLSSLIYKIEMSVIRFHGFFFQVHVLCTAFNEHRTGIVCNYEGIKGR